MRASDTAVAEKAKLNLNICWIQPLNKFFAWYCIVQNQAMEIAWIEWIKILKKSLRFQENEFSRTNASMTKKT